MPGKVFAARDNAIILKACYHSKAEPAYGVWVITECPFINNRIIRIGINIKDRRKIGIDADCLKLLCCDFAEGIGKLNRIAFPDCRISCKLRKRFWKPADLSPFLINTDKKRRLCHLLQA